MAPVFWQRWKWTISMVVLIVLAMTWTLAGFIVGWYLLGWRTGLGVFLMVFGYTAFGEQVKAVVEGVRKIRQVRT